MMELTMEGMTHENKKRRTLDPPHQTKVTTSVFTWPVTSSWLLGPTFFDVIPSLAKSVLEKKLLHSDKVLPRPDFRDFARQTLCGRSRVGRNLDVWACTMSWLCVSVSVTTSVYLQHTCKFLPTYHADLGLFATGLPMWLTHPEVH